MNRQVSLLLVAVLFGIVVGAVVVSRPSHDEPLQNRSPTAERVLEYDSSRIESNQLAETLETLTKTLNEEEDERRLLAQKIEQLQADVKQLQDKHRDGDEAARADRLAFSRAREERFAEVGFTWQDLEAVAPLLAEMQVRAGQLDDLARREGWINTSRYAEEMDALSTFESPLRDKLGDDRFDRYLYAMGRTNRVIVGAVTQTSEAQRAGFQSGDVIVRYGGEPVYSSWHLVNLRSSGNMGEPVVVEITRDGQPMRITIPRGPMGFGAGEESINPTTNIRSRSDGGD